MKAYFSKQPGGKELIPPGGAGSEYSYASASAEVQKAHLRTMNAAVDGVYDALKATGSNRLLASVKPEFAPGISC